MNQSPTKNRRANGSFGAKSKLGGFIILALLGVYSFAAPRLNDRLGWNLPQIRADSSGDARLADSPRTGASPSNSLSPAVTGIENDAVPSGATNSGSRSAEPIKPESSPITTGPAADLRYGLLREVSRDRYLSPAGLLYTPGSAEGHRLDHLRRHTKDDPSRPGSHGVFDGEMEGALKTIDRAYQKARRGEKSTVKVDDRRTIYTVDMGGRVGFVGGREGGRERNPMARRVRLVLEGNRVITAYPL